MYDDANRADVVTTLEDRLLAMSSAVFGQFCNDIPKEARDAWVSLIILVLREMLALDNDRVWCCIV